MTVPENLPDAEMLAWWALPRQCAKCGTDAKREDFPMTTCRGKFVLRTWCKECLGAYYRAKSQETQR